MTLSPVPLPDDLTVRPVSVSALPEGLAYDPMFARPFRGVRSFGPRRTDARQRVEEAALLLPRGGALAGWAAALVHGFPWTDGETAGGAFLPVPVVVPRDHQIRVRPGLRVVRGLLRPGDVTVVDGLSVTTPARTAFDEMRTASDCGWALARADAAVRSTRVAVGQLVSISETRPGWRGVIQARTVAPLANPRSESSWESRLRWLWISSTNRVVLANENIFGMGDEWLARVDLLDPEAGIVGEFDGSDHGRPGQRAQDLARDDRLERTGLIVVRATSAMVGGQGYPALAALRRAYAAAARRTEPMGWATLHPR